MSSLPGLTLEAFVIWNYDINVEDQPEANFSIGLAEAMGKIPCRPCYRPEEFKKLIEIFEPYRDDTERTLEDFDEETQSWRDYAGACFDFIPNSVYAAGQAYLNTLRS